MCLITIHHENNNSSAGLIYFKKQFSETDVKWVFINETCLLLKLIYAPRLQRLLQRFYLFRLALSIFIAFYLMIFIKLKYPSMKKVFVNSSDFAPIFAAILCKYIMKCKIQLTIFDLPETFARTLFDQFLLRMVFNRCITHFHFIDVVTDAMQSHISNFTMNSKIFVTYTCCNFSDIKKYDLKTGRQKQKEFLKLVYVGSLRFKSELTKLLDYLNTQKILYQLDLFSSDEYMHPQVTNKGFKKDISKYLTSKKYDFGVVPMSFSLDEKLIVSTSLPSKIGTYISAKIPIMFVVPKWSSCVHLLQMYKIGLAIDLYYEKQIDQSSLSTEDYRMQLLLKDMEERKKQFVKFCEAL